MIDFALHKGSREEPSKAIVHYIDCILYEISPTREDHLFHVLWLHCVPSWQIKSVNRHLRGPCHEEHEHWLIALKTMNGTDKVQTSSDAPYPATSSSFEPLTPPPEPQDAYTRQAYHVSSSRTSTDLERDQGPTYTRQNDPFELSSRLRSTSELESFQARSSRHCNGFAPGKRASKARRVQSYYQDQNTSIERWLRPVDEHVRLAREFENANQLRVKIAVQGSFIANLLLVVLQIYGATASGSLSLFTTMADAIFDPLSNITLIACNRAVQSVDPRKFPSGKARIETAGNIVFCFLMTSVSFILIAFSILELARGSEAETSAFHLPSVVAVSIAFVTKLCLFLYCWTLRNQYSQIRILWEDHRNDMFINGFGVLTSVGGAKLKWWIDPSGAIILSCLVAVLWLRTAYKEFQLLIGISAPVGLQQWITYISMTHSPLIEGIDTVRAYHSGPRIIVEIDVVIDKEVKLEAAHDVAEELQMKLESLPDIERAYVHIDYETSHKPEHSLKKVL